MIVWLVQVVRTVWCDLTRSELKNVVNMDVSTMYILHRSKIWQLWWWRKKEVRQVNPPEKQWHQWRWLPRLQLLKKVSWWLQITHGRYKKLQKCFANHIQIQLNNKHLRRNQYICKKCSRYQIMYKQKTCVFHRLAKSFCQFCWRGCWLCRARDRSRVKVISYPPIVLKVWVITKMLSMPIPRRRKGITAKGTHYRFHLCLGVCSSCFSLFLNIF